MSGDHTLTIKDKLSVRDLHILLSMLQSCREVTVKMDNVNAIADWHDIELSVIAAHERRVRGAGGRF